MWQAFLTLLPDWGWRIGYEIARDLLGVGVACLAALLAYLAIKLGKAQASIAATQSLLAAKQTEIAETQHRIMQEQLARRAELTLVCLGRKTNSNDRSSQYEVMLHNSGTKGCRGVRWTLEVPREFIDLFEFPDHVQTRPPHGEYPGAYFSVTGLFADPVFPTERVHILGFGFGRVTEGLGRGTRVEWTLSFDDGHITSRDPTHQAFHLFQDGAFSKSTSADLPVRL